MRISDWSSDVCSSDLALAAELFRRRAHEVGIVHRGGVDGDLVGARQQELADVLDRAHAAADRQRHEAALGGAADDIEQDAAVLMARRYVEEAELDRKSVV